MIEPKNIPQNDDSMSDNVVETNISENTVQETPSENSSSFFCDFDDWHGDSPFI